MSWPYTIVTRRGRHVQETLGDYADDADALRWAYFYLGRDNAETVRVYRGYGFGGCRREPKPFAEIDAPEDGGADEPPRS